MRKIFNLGLLVGISILSLYPSTDTYLVEYSGMNNPPIALNDTVTMNQGDSIIIDVLANDTDPEGGLLNTRYVEFLGPANGTARVQNEDEIIYTPNDGYVGIDSFQYFSCDASSECSIAWIFLTIEDVPEPPIIDESALGSVETDEDTPLDILVGENTIDPDGESLDITILDDVVNGSTVVSGDTINYTPSPDYNGLDSLRYIMCDPTPLCDTLWTIITVHPVNDPPIAEIDQITLTEDTVNVILMPLINDSDIDGDQLTIGSIVSTNTTATIAITDDTTVTYTPPTDYFAVDTLLYEVCDLQICIVDTIIVTVTPVNDSPIANDDSVTLDEDNTVTIPISDNDMDIDSDILTITIITTTVNGIAVVINDSLQYTPNLNFNGLDSLQYTLCDAEPLCDTAWVRISTDPVNDSPTSTGDQFTLTEDTTNAILLPLINDSDTEGEVLNIGSIISINTTASIVITDDTTITYTPPADYFGVDTLLYEVCDVLICIVDTIIVTVTPINDPPIANDDSVTLDEDNTVLIPILDNDMDIDSDNPVITIITNTVNGTTSIINDSIQFSPNLDFNGLDSLQYTLCDSEPLCDTAWVRITIDPVNDPPGGFGPPGVPNSDGEVIICVVEDTTNVIVWPFGGPPETDGDELIISSITSTTSSGTITIQGDTTFIYTPPADWNGMDTIGIDVCDPLGLCIIDTIYIDVKPVVDSLNAIDDYISLTENDTALAEIIVNDYNPDNSDITITIITQPTNGSAELQTGLIEYTPFTDFFGTDSLTYEICDKDAICDTATVYITIAFLNEKPVAEIDIISITDTSCITLDILANDSDPNHDTLFIEILNGRSSDVTIGNDGMATYCPPDDFMLTDTIYYAVCDTHAMQLCDTSFIVLNMTCPRFNHALAHDAICPNVAFNVTGTDVKALSQYEWSFTDQLGLITTEPTITELKINNPKRIALKSQRYGCNPQYDSINIVVRSAVRPADLDAELIECEDASVSLSINASDDQLNYEWYYASTNTLVGNGSELLISELNSTTAGNYYVIASDGFCISEQSGNLNLEILTDLTSPTIEAGEDQLICGQEISLNATPLSGAASWSTSSNAFIADVYNPTTRIFDPEIGENIFYWTQENASCIDPSIDSVRIFYYPLPDPIRDSFFVELNEDYTFDLKPNDNYYNLNASITVLNLPEEIVDLGGGIISVNIDGSKKGPLDFEYEVCFDECPDNCQSTVVNIYFEKLTDCVVPDVITPNGDGINDYLVVDCNNQYPQSTMIIFNRWGDEVYNNENYDNSWNGMQDGKPLAVGTYFYLFKINNAEESVETGFIHVDR